MTNNKLQSVNQCIRDAAYDAAAVDGLSMPVIERFLRTGEETWEGAGSGLFTRTQLKQDEAYTKAVKAAIRRLLTLLGDLSRPKSERFRRCLQKRFGAVLNPW